MRESQLAGRSRLAGLSRQSKETAAELDQQRGRFQALADATAAPRVVSSFNLFQTPEPLAARLVDLADLGDRQTILEPSAGLGRIYRAIRNVTAAPAVLVDISPDCCCELRLIADRAEVINQDFLTYRGEFSRVVMNPPFKMGTDVKHIRHAISLLSPGGRLVSLCYNGTRQQQLKDIASYWEVLPSGTFKSEGTDAETAIFVYGK